MDKTIHDHEWWLPYIEEFENVDISLQQYCLDHGFKYSAMYWHIRREKNKKKAPEEIEFLPVTVVDQISYPVMLRTDSISVSINGINVSGDTDAIRKILGVQL